jgi:CHAD domain-containing protein
MKIIPAKIYHRQLDQIKANSKKVTRSDDPDSLHDLRVAVMRFELASDIFSKFIFLDQKPKDRLKSARKKMGEVRDLDVLLAGLKSGLKNPQVIKKIGKHRRSKRRKLARLLKSPSYAALLCDLGRVSIHPGGVKKSFILKELSTALGKVFRGKKQLNAAKGFHKLRIAFKELRYTCEFFNKAFKKTLVKSIAVSKEFQNLLGERQDAVTAIDMLSSLSIKDRTGIKGFVQVKKQVIKIAEKQLERRWEEGTRF